MTPKNGVIVAVLLLIIFLGFNKVGNQLVDLGMLDMLAQVPAITVNATVSPSTVPLGASTTLSWTSVNATGCTLDLGNTTITGQATSGSYVAVPYKSMNYVVRCTGPGGSGRGLAYITIGSVINAAPTVNAGADLAITLPTSTSAPSGAVATDSDGTVVSTVWAFVSGPSTPTIANGNTLTPSFSNMSTAGTYVFSLTATDNLGAIGTDTMQVVVTAVSTPTLSISANPSSINSGASSVLSWSSSNVSACSASGGWSGSKALTGTQSVSPTSNTTYTLTCTGPGGSVNQSATVNVTAVSAPTLSISANPASITSGSSSVLTWSSTNTTSCTGSGGWSGSKTLTGTQSVSPTATTTYTLTCSGPGGNIAQNATVTVLPAGPITNLVDYRFEESLGQSLVDSSPNSLTGFLGATNQVESSDPLRTPGGVVGNALVFDGVDDYISLPNNTLTNNLANFTLEAWINPTSYLDASDVLGELFDKGNGKKSFFINSAVGSLGGIVLHTSNPAVTYTSTVIPLNQWSHVAMTYSSTTRRIEIYVNGVPTVNAKQTAGSGTAQTDGTTAPTNWLVGSAAGTGAYFNGKMDYVRLHNKVFTPAEILTQYNSFLSVDSSDPSVVLTSPQNNFTVKGVKLLTAEASDDVGIAGVRFQLNGANYAAEDTTFPYSIKLDSMTVPNGVHTVRAVARDKTNKTTTSNSVNITVDNTQVNTRKNIVLIMTDDQRPDTMQYMPITTSLFSTNTVKFTNATASDPVCCPSRASFLTGLYAHHHKVKTVLLGTSFDDRSTIATWAEEQGYRTGLIGKYMVSYLEKLSDYVPRGWSHWEAFAKQGNLYSNYTINENGVLRNYGTGDANYSTNVITAKAVNFIETTPASQPLMLYFTPSAPHAPANPASVDAGDFASLSPWRPPSYNESDVSDKPNWVKKLPSLTSTAQANIDSLRKKQIESLQSLDRGIADIFDALDRTGRLNDTIIVFTSDQGKSWGEHRWGDKECIYEECILIPMWIKTPGGVNATNTTDLVQNIDIVPTFTDIAGISSPVSFNGRSLKDILMGQQTGPLRSEALYEFGGVKDSPNRIVIETAFSAVRDGRYVYAEYTNGDREFYDLQADPHQLVNQINNPAYSPAVSSFQSKLFSLQSQ